MKFSSGKQSIINSIWLFAIMLPVTSGIDTLCIKKVEVQWLLFIYFAQVLFYQFLWVFFSLISLSKFSPA